MSEDLTEPTTWEPLDTTEAAMDTTTLAPTDQNTDEDIQKDVTTKKPQHINIFTPKPIDTAEPTESFPSETDDTVATETISDDVTTILPMIPAQNTRLDPNKISKKTSGNDMSDKPKRPHPQRVDSTQDVNSFGTFNIPSHTRPNPAPPIPFQVRPNRRVVTQRLPSLQGFPHHINLHPQDPFIRQILSQQDLGFPTPRSQVRSSSVRERFQPPHRQHFRTPSDQQVVVSQVDQSFQPPVGQQFNPPVDQQFKPDDHAQPPPDQEFRIPINQHSQSTRDQEFRTPSNQHSQSPRDQEFRTPSNQHSQSPRDQEFRTPSNQHSESPRDQEFRIPINQHSQSPRDQEFRTPSNQHSESPNDQHDQVKHRTAEKRIQVLQEDEPLDVVEEDPGLQGVEEILTSFAEGVPALPPPHPICFSPGLVPDEHRCWVFHECEIENGEWQVYSWKCISGHVFDPFNVACVPGRCRRRG